ncbi:hypothetical protein SE17_32330, partial [Kouleothrix aurantiaca]
EQRRPDAQRFGPALLDALERNPAAGLARFDAAALAPAKDVKAAVVVADLLRTSGNSAAARALFSQQFVDNANPVQFAWDWLHPAPVPGNALDIAGNLDLGYLRGCYLGEGDPKAGGNFRWCTDGAQLRFPAAGTGAAQRLIVRADGRGWAGYAAVPPPVTVWMNNRAVGTFTPSLDAPAEFTVALPPSPPGADVVLTLRTPTFVPDTARAKGLSERMVVMRHALKNALIPLITVFGPQIPNLITGTIFVEVPFRVPGLGKFFVSSIYLRDYPMIMATMLLVAMLWSFTYLLSDILYTLVDPRVRLYGE